MPPKKIVNEPLVLASLKSTKHDAKFKELMEANESIFSPKLDKLASRVKKLNRRINKPKKEQLGILKSSDEYGFYIMGDINRGRKKVVAFELPEIKL